MVINCLVGASKMYPGFVLIFSVQALKRRNIIGVGEALPMRGDGLSAIAGDISPFQGFEYESLFCFGI